MQRLAAGYRPATWLSARTTDAGAPATDRAPRKSAIGRSAKRAAGPDCMSARIACDGAKAQGQQRRKIASGQAPLRVREDHRVDLRCREQAAPLLVEPLAVHACLATALLLQPIGLDLDAAALEIGVQLRTAAPRPQRTLSFFVAGVLDAFAVFLVCRVFFAFAKLRKRFAAGLRDAVPLRAGGARAATPQVRYVADDSIEGRRNAIFRRRCLCRRLPPIGPIGRIHAHGLKRMYPNRCARADGLVQIEPSRLNQAG